MKRKSLLRMIQLLPPLLRKVPPSTLLPYSDQSRLDINVAPCDIQDDRQLFLLMFPTATYHFTAIPITLHEPYTNFLL